LRHQRRRLRVGRIQRHDVDEHPDLIVEAACLLQPRGDVSELAQGGLGVADPRSGARGDEPGIQVIGVERAHLDRELRGPPLVATRLAAFRQLVEVLLGVGEQPLARRNLSELEQRRLVAWLDLEDLLVERAGLRVETLGLEVVGDADVVADALVDLSGPDVEIAERVGAVPIAGLGFDNLDVFSDRCVDLAKLQGLFGALERSFTVKRRHSGSPQAMVSNSVGGLNDRRCCTE
jgi:hypothetical protein